MTKRRKSPSGISLPKSDNAVWLLDRIVDYLKPQPLKTVSEYVDNHLQLPPPANFSGAYTVRKTPYAKEIMDEMSPTSPTTEIVICMGTQMSKTQVELNAVAYYLKHDPTSILFAQSNKTEMKLFYAQRIKPMIDHNPELRELVSRSTLDIIEFPGGYIKMASGEAANSLKSIMARVVILDEYDGWPDNVEGQGSGKSIAEKRAMTYGDRRKIIISSTPTNQNSKILALLESTDQRHYFVQCPHCNQWIEFEWEHFRWDADGEDVSHAWYECQLCHGVIEDYQKEDLLSEGVWKPTNTKKTDPRSVGFWVPGTYSPFTSWHDIVVEYLKAKARLEKGKDGDMTSFYNNVLALPYEGASVKPDKEKMMAWANHKDYAYYAYEPLSLIEGELPTIRPFPKDVLFLTSGTDVQKDRIEVEIKGWGKRGMSWSIMHYVFWLNAGESITSVGASVWLRYKEKVLDAWFEREDGLRLQTLVNAMDSNYHGETINALYNQYNTQRFIPILGSNSMADEVSGWKSKILHDTKGNPLYTRHWVFIGVSVLKGEAYASFRYGYDQDAFGISQFPADYEEEYYEQLLAETYVPGKGRMGKWIKDRERNEAIDIHVYNLGMWYYLGANLYSDEDYDNIERDNQEKLKSQVERKTAPIQKVQGRRSYRATTNW